MAVALSSINYSQIEIRILLEFDQQLSLVPFYSKPHLSIMSNPHHDDEKLTHVVDCVTDIDDYPPIEKCETNDSNELKSDQKIVLVTGGAGKNLLIGSIAHRS